MADQPSSIAEAFQPLLPDVAPREIPMFLAVIERLAGQQYRRWAEDAADAVERAGLLACADREDEIAVFIESLETDAGSVARALHERFPDLQARYDGLLRGLDRRAQLRAQAEGELAGADFMRQFAAASSGAVAARYESLACCEEANSRFLSRLVAE